MVTKVEADQALNRCKRYRGSPVIPTLTNLDETFQHKEDIKTIAKYSVNKSADVLEKIIIITTTIRDII